MFVLNEAENEQKSSKNSKRHLKGKSQDLSLNLIS